MTAEVKATTCGSCNAPIFWGITAAGRRMPIDLDPNPDGNVHIISFADDGTPHVEIRSGASLLDEPAVANSGPYMPHFAGCPNAALHRQRR